MACMDAPFATPGMTAMTIVMGVILALSIGLFAANVAAYAMQRRKYAEFFRALEARDAWGRPGRFIVPVYAVVTIASAVAIAYLFLFQPHVL